MKLRAHTCKRCGAAIVWMRTIHGKAMPVNAKEGLRDDMMFFRSNPDHVVHWATCPDAIEFRKPKIVPLPEPPIRAADEPQATPDETNQGTSETN